MRTTPTDTFAPFTGSTWLWLGDCRSDLVNRHLYARRAFTLTKVPRSAELCVTADSRYRLWVNGTPVCRGPARGYQAHWPFDRVDVAPFLVAGDNIIAVQVHSLGVGTFGYVHAGAAGLLVAGRIGTIDVATGKDWKARNAPDQARHLRRASLQLGFQEHIDLALVEPWQAVDYDASAWETPSSTPLGAMPWHTLEERGIPLMREAWQSPTTQVQRASGPIPSTPAAVECPLVAWRRDKPTVRAAVQPLRLVDGWAEITLDGRSELDAVVLDFGEEVVGSLELALPAGSGVIDTLATEAVAAEGPVFHDPAFGCLMAFALRLRLADRAATVEQFDHWGFRYLIIAGRHLGGKTTLRVRLRTVGYPLDAAAPLRTADPILDGIWDISVRAQQRCSLDAFTDCPWREQAQWWGDARVQAANTHVLCADHRLLARGIRSIAGQSVPNGLTYGHAPTIAHSCILPDFTLTWISTLHDLWWQTGDLSAVREQLPRVREALSYFRDKLQTKGPATGLLPYDQRYWLFLDWCPIFKDGYPTLYNLFWMQALDHLSGLLGRLGERREAAQIAREAKASRRALRKLQSRGVFAGGRDWRGHAVAQDSAHCDALAYLNAVVPEYNGVLVQRMQALCTHEISEKDPMRPSPFFMHYILSALDQAGEGETALSCIRRWWGSMVERGLSCTEETWFAEAGSSSLCHAWSAHPIVHLTRLLLGVRQTSAGWKSVEIRPLFHGERASGAVATPHGAIHVHWERTARGLSGEARIPRGIKATLALPGGKPKPASGTVRFRLAQ